MLLLYWHESMPPLDGITKFLPWTSSENVSEWCLGAQQYPFSSSLSSSSLVIPHPWT